MDRYVEMSRRIFAVFQQYTPLVEPLSIDEAFLDVTGCQRLFGSAREIGLQIKNRIRREIGLTASVGVAGNKFLAKLASDLQKPDGFVVITRESADATLAELPVGRLWGVGQVSARRLGEFGIRKIKDLLAVPPENLVREFGDHMVHLLELARGEDDRPVVPGKEAKSVGNEVTFREDIGDPRHLQEVLDELADKVAWRLRTQDLLAGNLVLKVRYPDFQTVTRTETLPGATAGSKELREAARRLLTRQRQRRRGPLRLIGVTAGRLQSTEGRQTSLFTEDGTKRDHKIDRLLDQVTGRFGPKLRRGTRTRDRGD
jgi:DNA polymerase-4